MPGNVQATLLHLMRAVFEYFVDQDPTFKAFMTWRMLFDRYASPTSGGLSQEGLVLLIFDGLRCEAQDKTIDEL